MKRFVGYRRKPLPFRSLREFMVIGEGAHRQVVLRETGKPDWSSIEPVYEGDPGWEEVAADIAAARNEWANE